jgi:hypothetical protein
MASAPTSQPASQHSQRTHLVIIPLSLKLEYLNKKKKKKKRREKKHISHPTNTQRRRQFHITKKECPWVPVQKPLYISIPPCYIPINNHFWFLGVVFIMLHNLIFISVESTHTCEIAREREREAGLA